MYKLMRAAGLSMYQKEQDMARLLKRLVREAEMTGRLTEQEGSRLYELRAEVTPGMGIAVIDKASLEGTFSHEYYFPYVKNPDIGSEAECPIQHHTERKTYTDLLDEYRVDISPIFYMEDSTEYRIRRSAHQPIQSEGATLTRLAVQGKALLSADKTEKQAENFRQAAKEHSSLLEAAKHSNEDATEMLTIEGIDLYSMISRRIAHEDVYSIIETCFMPCGIKCDQYSAMGGITETSISTNQITRKETYNLKLDRSDMISHMAINKQDLLGESRTGRRFEGQVWIQGTVLSQRDASTKCSFENRT